jgi:hypothetical protein
MTELHAVSNAMKAVVHPLKRWLLRERFEGVDGPHEKPKHVQHEHSWWRVMCLTGVDYFSTLGYQPGIAALAAGALSPIATLILVLLTLFGAFPIYRRVAVESPHGEGSIAMLASLLRWWQGKLMILVLLGFVATDFIITITLSTADATAHIIENPLAPHSFHGQAVAITLILIGLLGAVFLKGFKEAIGIAVGLTGVYLLLNAIVLAVAFCQVATHAQMLVDWKTAIFISHGSPLAMIGVSLLLFPKLALGLSGFETGVAVMPLVKGSPEDTEQNPAGRIRHTHWLLLSAALIMSVFLIASSLVTTLLISAADFRPASDQVPAGPANGRALAFLAHRYLGDGFGTAYDLSTILILWFAGASAMAGLVNIVPRYLPRYGMAPEWAAASRPLVLIYIAIAFAVTIIFEANVHAQGGAYATGVLVLMTSAAIAVTLSAWRKRSESSWPVAAFALIAAIFLYTTIANIVERPDGVKIAAFFIGSIVITSMLSRVWRTTELRVETIEIDCAGQHFLDEALAATDHDGVLRIIANEPDAGDAAEYESKHRAACEDHLIPAGAPVLFLEIYIRDASEFSANLSVRGFAVGPHRVLRAQSAAVPNAIAAFLLHLRDHTGTIPHAYFNWSEGNPLLYLIRYVLSGQGDVAPLTREILRQAEADSERRPAIHAGV